MLKSMTAYSRISFHSDVGDFVVELQSVNRKHLEIYTSIPKELSCFEVELKKWLQPHVSRGNVTLKISVSYENSSPILVHPNLPLARQILQAWNEIAEDLKIDKKEVELELLKDVDGILLFEENLKEENRYLSALKQALDMAITQFLRMKMQEGAVLQIDILERSARIRQWMKEVEKKVPHAVQRYRTKLIARLEEILPGKAENEDKILREIAIFAEKVDIAEEVTRFTCHLTHFEELVDSEASHVGKTLEFVLQELNREVNTIGSKSNDIEIARLVIDIKSELERIREQIQNVE